MNIVTITPSGQNRRYVALLCLCAAMVLMFPACEWFSRKDIVHAPFHGAESKSVEAALAAMTDEQKVAQLIIARVSDESLLPGLYQDAARGLLGGVILHGLAIEHYLLFADSLKQVSPWPLIMGTLETALLNNQFCDADPFPHITSVDACASTDDKSQMRALFRRQAALTGINWSLETPLYRGSIWDPVTQLPRSDFTVALKPFREWNQEGMIRLGNSFSHLVYMPKDTANLVEQILSPYRRMVRAGISGFWINPLVLHDESPRNYLRNYLRDQLGFEGLLAGAGEMERLVHAGADLVISDGDPALARDSLLQLVEQRKLNHADLNQRVRRVLSAKYWSAKKRNSSRNIQSTDSALIATPRRLFSHQDLAYQALRLWENSPIALQDSTGMLPLKPGVFRPVALGQSPFVVFQERADKYATIDTVLYWKGSLDSLSYCFDPAGAAVLLWESTGTSPLADSVIFETLKARSAVAPVVLLHFGDPSRLTKADPSLTIVHAFERNPYTEQGVANLLFGAQAATARLPDAIDSRFAAGSGLTLPKVRLRYATPFDTGISPEKLVGIDAIAGSAIAQNIIPGCQVLIAQAGQVIYSKSFGAHDYSGSIPVTSQSLYDIASITKVAATTLALMQLKDQGKIDLDNRVRDFIPAAQGKNGAITVKQLLTHTSGLQSNLPISAYVKSPLLRRRACNAYFCNTPRRGYSVEVAKGLFFKDELRNKLMSGLHKLPVQSRAGTRYSDVNMVILQQMLEKAGGRPLDRYVQEYFFNPLGLRRITYRPKGKFPLSEIVPTENDTRWRQQVVHGYVHDPAAALMGGVAGHAGLFSNAEDLAVVFQLLLDEGNYGGRRYIEPATVKLFTGADSKSKRGLGFDKPRKVKYPSFSENMPPESFGHTGFTGTCVWVDPQRQLLYVFLSNRVHPKAQNTAFFQNNIRKRIHEVVYDALDTYEPGWGY